MKRAVLFGIVFALLMASVPGQVYVRSGNLWTASLEQNCESLLLLFRSGDVVVITENLDHKVTFPWDRAFRDNGPGDLIVVIHNHLTLMRWSDPDIRLYHRLKEAGFRGEFLCRLGNGQVIKLED